MCVFSTEVKMGGGKQNNSLCHNSASTLQSGFFLKMFGLTMVTERNQEKAA